MGQTLKDKYVDNLVSIMKPEPQDSAPGIWSDFAEIVAKHDKGKAFSRFKANRTHAVQTGSTTHYANICLQKACYKSRGACQI